MLHLYNAFTFPLRYSKFTLLFDSSTFLSAFGQFISLPFFGQTQKYVLLSFAGLHAADFDSGSKNELHPIHIFLVNKVSLKEQMLLTNS